MKNPILLVSVVAALPFVECARAEQIPSAAEALKEVLLEVEKQQGAGKSQTYQGIYEELLKVEGLEIDKQAAAWAEQLDALSRVKDRSGWEYQRLVQSMLLKSFPHVDSWPELAQSLSQISEEEGLSADSAKALKLLVKVLEADQEGFEQLLYEKKPKAKAKKSLLSSLFGGGSSRQYDQFASLKNNYSRDFGDTEMQLAAFQEELTKAQLKTENYVNISVPPLVSYVGEEKAKPMLEEVVKLMMKTDAVRDDRVSIHFSADKPTLKLLQKILKETEGAIAVYPSELMEAFRDEELLARMLKSIDQFSEYDRESLRELDFDLKVCAGDVEGAKKALGEIRKLQAKETQESLKGITKLDPQLRALLEEKHSSSSLSVDPQNSGEKVIAFGTLKKLIDEPRSEGVWSLLNRFGLELGKTDQVLDLFSEKFPGVEPKSLNDARVLEEVAEVYLSLDAVEKGKALRERSIAFYEKEFARFIEQHNDVSLEALPVSELANLYARQGKLAVALEEIEEAKEWYGKVLALPEELELKEVKDGKRVLSRIDSTVLSSVSELIKLEEMALAQESLVDLLELYGHFENQNRAGSYGGYYRSSDQASVGEVLVELYRAAESADDIVWLLENFPYWEKKDLFEMTDRDFIVDAAWALSKTGKADLAFGLLKKEIMGGKLLNHDPAYKLLLSLKNPETAGFLEQLAQQNPFQERPLIWQAQIAVEVEDFVKAEKLARKGIAIDPSDGEQGKDDRMQVYAVLADALAGQGKEKDAHFFREVVAAIRMGERADTLFYAGLTKRALEQYNQSLEHFADAYCLQSRLAVYHAEMGENDKAEQYYQRAFELMPSSFGRVESHCFGCEGAFSGKTAQSIAERVFKGLIQKNPKHPQTYYLMGYLEDSRNRDDAALKYYKKAVELDPLYLNAWKKIVSTGAKPNKETLQFKQQAALQLLKLDPQARQTSRGDNLSFRLKEAYGILAAAPVVSSDVQLSFPLPASAENVKKREQGNTRGEAQTISRQLDDSLREKDDPRSIIWGDEMVGRLLQLYLGSLYRQ
jgi:tetratricopeptide (TPR) repeat protein